MRGFTKAAIAICVSSLTQILAAPATPFEIVETENGSITGHRSAKAEAVWEYLGIPYAQPPLGELRFAPPQKYTANGSFIAEKFGYDCPSQPAAQPAFPGFTSQARTILAYFTGSAGTQRSEDCLTLNIWSKPTTKSYRFDKPVFVLFHGGRFAGGNTNTPFAHGQYLANAEDIIVVSVNYRLNVFGFPGAPGIASNLGLRDQRIAVEWIQKNIRSFGGNPKKIVIAGQSSGGVAVDWWSYAYRQNPIVHGLISTSGNAFSFPMNTPQKQLSNWDMLSTSLGCGNSSSSDTVSCMRKVPFETISAAASKIAPSPGGSPVRSTPPFYPGVDNYTVFADYLSLSSSGSFAKLPYLQGYNDFEQGYYVIPAFAQGRNVTQAQGAQLLLESFVCPIAHEAQQRINANVSTWVYRYFGNWENTLLYPTSGAYHGTELHMILGGSEDASGLPQTLAQKDMVKLVQRALAAFVEDPKNGLTRLGWPRYDAKTESLIELAVGNQPRVTFAKPEKYDRPCANITLGALSVVS